MGLPRVSLNSSGNDSFCLLNSRLFSKGVQIMKVYQTLGILAAAAIGLAAIGCSTTETPQAGKSTPPAHETQQKQENAAGTEKSGTMESAAKSDSENLEGLAELSPEDRAAAEAQRVCPVSGETLGAMGKPVKITVNGREVFLCCSGCEDAIRKSPDKYLAKLPKKE
jgi:hypothetical protein